MVNTTRQAILTLLLITIALPCISSAKTFEHTLTPGWNFISLPFVPSAGAPSSTIKIHDASSSGAELKDVGMLAVEDGVYTGLEGVAAHYSGRGYAVYAESGYALRTEGEDTPSGPVQVQLRKGWNLIGSPFDFPVLWGKDVTIDGLELSAAGALVEDTLYEYDSANSAYKPVEVSEKELEPWKAYFIKAKADCTLTFNPGGRIVRGDVLSVDLAGAGAQRAVAGEVVAALSPGADTAAFRAAVEALGGTVSDQAGDTGVYLVSVPVSSDVSGAADIVAAVTGVESAVPNIVLSPVDLTPNDPPFVSMSPLPMTWPFEKIGAPGAWGDAQYNRLPVVAVVDTGVDASAPDLAGRVLDGVSFTGQAATTDPNGHGTHAAGIIAALGNNSVGMAGVCWQCKVMPVQACDTAGNCPLFSVLGGIVYAADNGAEVINLSVSGYAPEGTVARKVFQAAVDHAASRGALVVGAAGNTSSDAAGTVPGGLNNVFAVAASGQSDGLASFSNNGATVDIAAPGEEIFSLLPSGGFGAKSGTSAAAAFVSGAAGLLLAHNAAMSPADAAAAIKSSAAPLASGGTISGGRLDIKAALSPYVIKNRAPVISGCAFSPSEIPQDGGTGASLACDVTDPDGNLTSVTADLTSIGGGPGAALVNSGSGIWRIDYISAGQGTPPGDYSIAVTALDTEGAAAAAEAAIKVLPPPNRAPIISSCEFAPKDAVADGVTASAVTANIFDPDGGDDVSSVSLDLSQAGIDAPVLLYDDGAHTDGEAGDGVYGASVVFAPGTRAGVFEMPVSATDKSAAAGDGKCLIGISVSIQVAAACTTDWPKFHCNTDNTGEHGSSVISTPMRQRWSYTIADIFVSSPVIDGATGKLYVANGVAGTDKNLFVINADTGALIQSCAMGGSSMSTPALSGGKVFLGSEDKKVYAFDASDCSGGPLWTTTTGNIVRSSPAVSGGIVYIGSEDGKMYALDENTGAQIWATGPGGVVDAIPLVAGGYVIFGIGPGAGTGRVFALNANTGATVWTMYASNSVTASAAHNAGKIFVGDFSGNMYALDINTGAILWRYTAAGPIYSSAALANGNLYFSDNTGRVYAVPQAGGAAIWTINRSSTMVSSPAVVNGKVVIGESNQTAIDVIDETTGTLLWRKTYSPSGNFTASPAIYNNRVYVGAWDKKLYCFEANLPPTVGAVTFTPATIYNDAYSTTTVTAVVSDPNGLSDIATVTINLTTIGGSASYVLYDNGTNGDVTASDGIYSRSGLTAATSTTAGVKTLTVTVLDTVASSATNTGSLTVSPNTAPTITTCSFSPSSITGNGVATTTLTCTGVSDAQNNLTTVTVNLTSIGGAAAAALTNMGGGTWQRTSISAASGTAQATYTLTITATDVASASSTANAQLGVASSNTAPNVTSCSFSVSPIAANAASSTTLTCTVTDAESNVSTVTANLTAIGGAAAAALTNMGGGSWQRTGITAATATVVPATYTIAVTATDSGSLTASNSAALRVTDPSPVVSGCSFSPTSIYADGSATTTLTCSVSDANSNLSTVTANLTSIGGGAAVALALVSGTTWIKSGITASIGTGIATYTITVTATDAAAGTGTGTAQLGVTDPAPVVSGCSFSPASITANGVATTTLSCTVTDLSNNVSTVTVNLASIGGGAAVALTNMGGGSWQKTSITASAGTTSATYTLVVTATDAAAGSGTGSAQLYVAGNNAPTVTSFSISPSTVAADGVTPFSATATVSDADGLSDISTVTIDLSSIGGSASAAMYDDGAHGDGAASDGVYGTTGTVASGTAASSYTLGVTAKDIAGATGGASTTITVTNTNNPPVVSSCTFTPSSIPANGATESRLQCYVADPEVNVSTVTADLSSIGGSAAEPLTALGTGYFITASFTSAYGTTPATYTITINATDTSGATGTATAAIGISSVNPWYVRSCAEEPDGHWVPHNNPGMVNMPRDVTVDSSNNIIVADTGNNRVSMFDQNCNYIRMWGYLGNTDGNFKQPTGIVFNPATNYVYVADYYDRVQAFTTTGTFVSKFTVYKPTSIAVDASGNMYVTSKTYNLISKYNSSGTLQATWTVDMPVGIDVDTSGYLYISSSQSNTIIKLDTGSGATSTIGSAGTGPAQFSDPRGVAVDTVNNLLFVADYGNNRVQQLSLSGTYVQEFNQYGGGPGQVNYAEGVALTNSKNLLLVDTLNSRVQEFTTH